MKRIIIFLTTAMIILSACSDKQTKQRKALGPSELLTEINVAFENKKFVTVTVLYRFLKSRHRNTPEYKEAENICSKTALLAEMNIALENKEFATVKILYEFLKSHHRNTLEYNEAERIYSKAEYIQRTEKIEETLRKAEIDRKTKLTALNRLRLKKTVDDILGITWYKQPYFEHFNWDNGISIYLGDNGAQHWLRLKMSYGGDDWIFFENAYLSYDGNTKEVLFDEYDDKKTEVGNYANFGWADRVMVSEWIDVPVTESVEEFLREYAKSTTAKMRLSGKHAKTRLLTDSERQGILDVLNAYDVFNGPTPNTDRKQEQ